MVKKIGRNDPCFCGSGKKYKQCCINKQRKTDKDPKKLYSRVYNINLKNKKDIEGIRKTGLLVIATLNEAENFIKAGVTTDYLDKIIHDFTIKNNAKPATLGYRGFPKSSCISVNEVVCHGVPGDRVIEDGDIVNIDITSILNGYYADASKTYFVGTPKKDAEKIVKIAQHAIMIGKNTVKPGNKVGDIGWAIQNYAEKNGCSVVRNFVGHGTGFDFHEEPQIPNFGRKKTGIELVEGMVFTIEPMINLGKKEIKILSDGWTAVTKDGFLSAQFEQTIVVTKDGCEALTPYDLT
ncbi:MAG: type I methionyl aminopeptidase [Deltaproteobacteria bacterium]|nr:type I methionyl aminopeptidase [Deltaproteobacteria bacterium]